ncbi:DUF6597 domain-containing transcriptional factor [Nannocystis pusilla]|uniref:DUF6597 domain-containing transcriptional factor n=1 Tax=Nannocystis pusilla TaxID=889268 RepID=UPI003DA69714
MPGDHRRRVASCLSRMPLVSRSPSPALAPFVAAIWRFRGRFGHAYERVLPSGAMQILVNLHEDELRFYPGEGDAVVQRLRGAIVCGARTNYVAIDTDEQRDIVGITFRPGGAFPFVAAPADASETYVELDALWGRAGALLRERLLAAADTEAILRTFEAALLAQAKTPLEPDPAVQFAVSSFGRGIGVTEVTKQLGMTSARFIRHFSKLVGLTPKRFARVLRFHRVLERRQPGAADRLGAGGRRVRLFRPGAPDPRVPRVLGDEPDGVPAAVARRRHARAARRS